MSKKMIVVLMVWCIALVGCGVKSPAEFIKASYGEKPDIEHVQNNHELVILTDLLNEEEGIELGRDVFVKFQYVPDQAGFIAFLRVLFSEYGYTLVVNKHIADVPVVSSVVAVNNVSSPAVGAASVVAPVAPVVNRHVEAMVISAYSGKLSGLLSVIRSHGYHVRVDGKAIILDESKTYTIKLPVIADIEKGIEKHLSVLGARSMHYDAISGVVSFAADSISAERIKKHLLLYVRNYSAAVLHVVLFDFVGSENEQKGIDIYKSLFSWLPTDAKKSVSWAGSGAFALAYKGWSLTSYLMFVEQRTNSRIVQDVYVHVVGGYKGKLDASTKLPVVDRVDVSTNAQGSQQGVQYRDIDIGTIAELSASVDANSKLVTVELKGKHQSIQRFVTLSTGEKGVTIDRPVLAVRSIDTRAVVPFGGLLVVGGMNYEQDNFGSSIGVKSSDVTRGRLVFFIAPEVVRIVVRSGNSGGVSQP